VLISFVDLNSIFAVRLCSNEDLPLLALLDTWTVLVWVCLDSSQNGLLFLGAVFSNPCTV